MTILRRLALLLSFGFIVAYLVLVALRVGHPYMLDSMEEAMVGHVLRVRAGLPLYVAPSIEFVPLLYPPLYFNVSAWLSALVGEGFLAPRLVSIAASLGCFATIAWWVHEETRSRAAALLAVGLFAACFRQSGGSFDIGRVDTLFTFLALLGAALLRTRRSALAAGLSFALAAATKQQGLLLALPLVVFAWVYRGPRTGLLFASSLACLAGGIHWLFEHRSDGWYGFYLYAVPSGHQISEMMILGYWLADVVPVAPAFFVALWCIASRSFGPPAEPHRRYEDRLFWLLFVGSAVGVSWASRMHTGGACNVLQPLHAALAVTWGVGLHRLGVARSGAEHAAVERGGDASLRRDLRRLLFAGLCVAQFLWLVYDPRPLVPGELERRAGDQFLSAIGAVEGEVWAPRHGYLPTLVGKRSFADRVAMNDVIRSQDSPVAEALLAEVLAAVSSRRFAAIVVDIPYFTYPYLRVALRRNYRDSGPMLDEGLELGAMLGPRANPRLYRPRELAPDAKVWRR